MSYGKELKNYNKEAKKPDAYNKRDSLPVYENEKPAKYSKKTQNYDPFYKKSKAEAFESEPDKDSFVPTAGKETKVPDDASYISGTYGGELKPISESYTNSGYGGTESSYNSDLDGNIKADAKPSFETDNNSGYGGTINSKPASETDDNSSYGGNKEDMFYGGNAMNMSGSYDSSVTENTIRRDGVKTLQNIPASAVTKPEKTDKNNIKQEPRKNEDDDYEDDEEDDEKDDTEFTVSYQIPNSDREYFLRRRQLYITKTPEKLNAQVTKLTYSPDSGLPSSAEYTFKDKSGNVHNHKISNPPSRLNKGAGFVIIYDPVKDSSEVYDDTFNLPLASNATAGGIVGSFIIFFVGIIFSAVFETPVPFIVCALIAIIAFVISISAYTKSRTLQSAGQERIALVVASKLTNTSSSERIYKLKVAGSNSYNFAYVKSTYYSDGSLVNIKYSPDSDICNIISLFKE